MTTGKRQKHGRADSRKVVAITRPWLRAHPLPQPDGEGDKETRGRVLIIGGSPETPGAVLLAATAALRAGAGKLSIAAGGSIARLLAIEIPESLTQALPETEEGALSAEGIGKISEGLSGTDAILIGPGMVACEATTQTFRHLLPLCETCPEMILVLDAGALPCLKGDAASLKSLEGRVILTPHAGEMANLLDLEKEDVLQNPQETAIKAARKFGAVVALKGAETYIVSPNGACYCNRTGNVGLATSGSGDTLAGIVAGLAARGAVPLEAAAWGVYLHGCAGDRLAERMGPLGFLARELLAEIPPLMAELSRRPGKR